MKKIHHNKIEMGLLILSHSKTSATFTAAALHFSPPIPVEMQNSPSPARPMVESCCPEILVLSQAWGSRLLGYVMVSCSRTHLLAEPVLVFHRKGKQQMIHIVDSSQYPHHEIHVQMLPLQFGIVLVVLLPLM